MAVWVYNLVTIYLISLGLTSILTSVFKIAVGRPRPHFLDVCQPNITLVNCTGFINEYSCQGTRTRALHDMNLSFVSGHSSVTAVTVAYVVLYLQKRLKLACAPMLRPVLQTAIICFGLYVAISRFTDNKHHVTDIIGGVILGAGTALTLLCHQHICVQSGEFLVWAIALEMKKADISKTIKNPNAFKMRQVTALIMEKSLKRR
ncbi:PAP2 family protein, partial [Opisthorchis viverrini]